MNAIDAAGYRERNADRSATRRKDSRAIDPPGRASPLSVEELENAPVLNKKGKKKARKETRTSRESASSRSIIPHLVDRGDEIDYKFNVCATRQFWVTHYDSYSW